MYQRQLTPNFSGRDLLFLLKAALDLNVQPGPGGSGMSEIGPTTVAICSLPINIQKHFPLPWSNCRIVGLWPGQQIPLHVDAPITGTRYHIPLQTNIHCFVYAEVDDRPLESCWQSLELGRVYTVDPTWPHGAVNWGDDVRLHLMIDVEEQK